MKKIFGLIIFLGLFIFAGGLLAGPCPPGGCGAGLTDSWYAINDPNPDLFFSRYGTVGTPGYYEFIDYGFTLDIKPVGFVPGSDIVTQYTLYIFFSDDYDNPAYTTDEGVRITVAGNAVNFVSPDASDYILNDVLISTSATLNTNGTLAIQLHRISGTGGDFYYNKTELWAEGNPTGVPEPATLLLLGAGLIGLAGYGRKKFLKK